MPVLDDLSACLSTTERARAQRFGTDELRRRWIAGRATLRLVLGDALGIAPSAVEIRRGVRGRPELADAGSGIDFNVSHTGGVALIGIAKGLPADTRIGVDIERLDREVGVDRLARKFLTATEQGLARGSRFARASRALRALLDVQGGYEQGDGRRSHRAVRSPRRGVGGSAAARRRSRALPSVAMDAAPRSGTGGVGGNDRDLASALSSKHAIEAVDHGAIIRSRPAFGYFQRFCSQSQSAGLARIAFSSCRANPSITGE